MFRTFLLGKLHRATITEADLNYIGSVTIDAELLERAGLYENEKVSIWNITNGSRLETYVLKGPWGSGCVKINGGAAHQMHVGDKVVIAWFGQVADSGRFTYDPPEPRILLLDDQNRVEN